jgi:hypothetical protein
VRQQANPNGGRTPLFFVFNLLLLFEGVLFRVFGEDMGPWVESLSERLGQVSAVSQPRVRSQAATTVGLMGLRHAHLVSPVVLSIFVPGRGATVVSGPDWQEPVVGWANILVSLVSRYPASDDSYAARECRLRAPLALGSIIEWVLTRTAPTHITIQPYSIRQRSADIPLSDVLREKLATLVQAVTGGWTTGQVVSFVREHAWDEDQERELFHGLLSQFLPPAHPFVVLLRPTPRPLTSRHVFMAPLH